MAEPQTKQARKNPTQGVMTKALKAAKAAGVHVVSFDIDESGRLSIKTANGASVEPAQDSFEQWKARRNARQS